MYFLLILFFSSLLGITFMIGRKLLMLQNGQVTFRDETETFLKAQYLETLKHSAIRAIRKYSYLGLVTTIRSYFRSVNFLKDKYQIIKTKIKNIYHRNQAGDEKKEVSKFLKMILEYKQKIRAIKHKIKEEEKVL